MDQDDPRRRPTIPQTVPRLRIGGAGCVAVDLARAVAESDSVARHVQTNCRADDDGLRRIRNGVDAVRFCEPSRIPGPVGPR